MAKIINRVSKAIDSYNEKHKEIIDNICVWTMCSLLGFIWIILMFEFFTNNKCC